jgi:hypothetical protein
MIRMMLHDDEQFRQLLRGLNRDLYHKIVTSKQVEDYISTFMGKDLAPFFNQYLRNTSLPAVLAKQHGPNITLTLRGYDDALRIPIYSGNRFICELSTAPVTIPVNDTKALRNYLIVYMPVDNNTKNLVR